MGSRQVRHLARETAIRALSVSGLRHALPDFLVIGIKKGGTSSLDHYLRQHPLVRGGSRKEPRFFHSHWSRGTLWYRKFFPLESDLRAQAARLGRRPLVFEATPDNLYWPEVPGRVAQVLPGRQFVALLRNPIDRAWSDYRAHVRAGREHREFEQVIDAELAVIEGGRSNGGAGAGAGAGPGGGPAVRLLSLGLYADQLDRWYGHVSPADVLVIESDAFFRDEAGTVRAVTDFLNLSPHDGYRFTPRNVGGYVDAMAPGTRARLVEFYQGHNRRLYERIGRDLEWG